MHRGVGRAQQLGGRGPTRQTTQEREDPHRQSGPEHAAVREASADAIVRGRPSPGPRRRRTPPDLARNGRRGGERRDRRSVHGGLSPVGRSDVVKPAAAS